VAAQEDGMTRAAPAFAWLLIAAVTALAPLHAQGRTPADAERLYREVGDQLFCTCGCREKLLSCSHNVCAAKDAQRAYLRELSQKPEHDAATMKQEMVRRFGPKVLQVPEDSSVFVVLGVSLAALLAVFGGMFWYVLGRGRRVAPESAAAAPAPDGLDERIERDMQELP
jgi:cytochrome c-type biogenesis protein CcmH/NrfF